jgi:hypothetical protein
VDAARFAVLHSVAAPCEVIRHDYNIYALDIEPLPPSWNPQTPSDASARLRQKKAAKRRGYPTAEPVWLVLPIADELRPSSKVLDALRADLSARKPTRTISWSLD